MKAFEALQEATPLEKARAFSLMANPEFKGPAVSNRYVKKVEEAIEDYDLEKYQKPILDQLSSFKGKIRDWQRNIDPISKEYESKLVKEYIISEMEEYEYLSQIKSKVIIQWAETLAAYLVGRGLQTNQIRKFLDSIRKVEVDVKKDLPENFKSEQVNFLKVHLAYASARQDEVKPLMLVMNTAINKVREEGEEGFEDFNQLVKFVEAVVAYHKFYGGND